MRKSALPRKLSLARNQDEQEFLDLYHELLDRGIDFEPLLDSLLNMLNWFSNNKISPVPFLEQILSQQKAHFNKAA